MKKIILTDSFSRVENLNHSNFDIYKIWPSIKLKNKKAEFLDLKKIDRLDSHDFHENFYRARSLSEKFYEITKDKINQNQVKERSDRFYRTYLYNSIFSIVSFAIDKYYYLSQIKNLNEYKIIIGNDIFDYKIKNKQDLSNALHQKYSIDIALLCYFKLFNNENINVLKTDKNFTKYDNIRSLNQIGASKGIAYKIKKYFFRNSARILVVGSWISKMKLIRHQFIKNNITYFDIRWVEFKLRKSEKLILIDEDDSQLDMFISECLNYLLPESLLIDFDYYEKLLDREINTKNLKYVLSEKWLTCDITSLIVSYLKEKGIKHITTQHGYQQLSMYNFLSVQSICSDILLTPGWNSKEYNNLESSGDWKSLKSYKKSGFNNTITYIPSGSYEVRHFFYDVPSCFVAENYYEEQRSVLVGLSEQCEKKNIKINYKKHKSSYLFKSISKNNIRYLSGKFDIHSHVDSLFIVDYIGTAFYEITKSELPFIAIFDKKYFPLNDNLRDDIKKLIKNKIIFTSYDDFINTDCNFTDYFNSWEDSRLSLIQNFNRLQVRSGNYFNKYIEGLS